MATFNKRIFDTTQVIEEKMAEKALQSESDEAQVPGPARTAPGRMLQTNGQIVDLQAELAVLRAKLGKWDGSMPTSLLDPTTIVRSRFANRHLKSFQTADFARLKDSIALAGGNVQPILVVKKPDDEGFELVFGHRRHQACLELGLPVLALIWDKPLSAEGHFLAMERENRERTDLSAFEAGTSYQAALNEGFCRSERQLAEAIGVHRRWVGKCLRVARLPPAIVEAFDSPLDIKPAHAEAIQAALEENSKAVLKRAEKLRQRQGKLRVSAVVAGLLGAEVEASGPRKMTSASGSFGSWRRDSAGRTIFTVDSGLIDDAKAEAIAAAISKVFSS
ncbi:ParB/RepB/Spo0J family partition protein [Variovorax sp. LjRoot178]|uniref:ParB/RepB/Spo0J family partition protein n=1 Tax=Variovorax sp. LjRoot178 TaxID=3342277 RepID=UPI003ECC1C5C